MLGEEPVATNPSLSLHNIWNWLSHHKVDAYRAYNAFVALAVLVDYFQNPEVAAAEYLPDVGIHALEAVAPYSLNRLSTVANLSRGIQAGFAFFSGKSTIPPIANAVDILNHVVNVAYRFDQ